MHALHPLAAGAIVATALLAAAPASAFVPGVDRSGKAGVVACGKASDGRTVEAVHVDKIIFIITGTLQAADPADQPTLLNIPVNTELDIKVLDNPRRVADLRGKVLTFLGAATHAANRGFIRIVDVDYAMVCPTQIP